MKTHRIIIVIISSFCIGICIVTASFFFVLPHLSTSKNTKESPVEVTIPKEIPAPDTTVPKVSTTTKRMLTYTNREFGFQVEYSEDYFASEQYAEKNKFEVNFVHIKSRSKDSYGQIDFSITNDKKTTPDLLLKQLNDAKLKFQREREERCKIYSDNEGFEQCAYYGGGWLYSTTTIGGTEAVVSEFAGEGQTESIVYFPTKGLALYYSPWAEDSMALFESFRFIDMDRQVQDATTGMKFTCQARWTCVYSGTQQQFQLRQNAELYVLKGPNHEYIELSLYASTTPAITTLIEEEKQEYDERKKETQKDKETCMQKASESFCQSYVTSGQFVPYKEYQFTLNDQMAHWFEYRVEQRVNEVLIYIPEKGWAIALDRQDFLVDEAFITAWFK